MDMDQARRVLALALAEQRPLPERITAAVTYLRWEYGWRSTPPPRAALPSDLITGVCDRLTLPEARRLWPRIVHGITAPPAPRHLEPKPPPTKAPPVPWPDPEAPWLPPECYTIPTEPDPEPSEVRMAQWDADTVEGFFSYGQTGTPDLVAHRPPQKSDRYEPVRGVACSICRGTVYVTSTGTTCDEGHDGAEFIAATFRGTANPKVRPGPPTASARRRVEPEEPEEVFDYSDVKIPLSEKQKEGLTTILTAIKRRKREVRLAGHAGAGKTTLMRVVLDIVKEDIGRTVYLLAPTNQARKRLQDVTKHEAGTLHAFIYPRPEETPTGELIFPPPRLLEDIDDGAVFIVDESSMIGVKIADDFRSIVPGGTILWVGDPAQLPPVGEKPGVDLLNAEVTLTEVHRQAAGSPILSFASEIRSTEFPPKEFVRQIAIRHGIPWGNGSHGTIAGKLLRDHRAGKDAVALAWGNEDRKEINRQYRTLSGASAPLHNNERIVICMNHYHLGLLNGDILFVEGVTWAAAPPWLATCIGGWIATIRVYGKTEPIFTTEMLLGADRRVWQSAMAVARAAVDQIFPGGSENHKNMVKAINAFVHADYAYCMTTHRYQGSQADTVYLSWSGNWTWNPRWKPPEGLARTRFIESRQWTYTSVTRAAARIEIVDLDNPIIKKKER